MRLTSRHATSGAGFTTSRLTNNSFSNRHTWVRCKQHSDGSVIIAAPLTEYSLRRWPKPSRGCKRVLPCASRGHSPIPCDAHCTCLEQGRFSICTFETADSGPPVLDYALHVKALAKCPKSASFERFQFCVVDSTERWAS